MPDAKLSVFIITKNEEKNIERCLRSVSWADEIVIADSFSEDKTIGICKRYTDKIYQKEFTDFADMKNFALSKIRGIWALSVDADEELTPGLKDELRALVNEDGNGCFGFYIKRRSRIFGRWFNFCGTQDDYQMRLFKSSKAHYTQPVHERVVISGRTGCLNNELLHYTYDSIGDYIKRMNRYTSIEAKMLSARKARFPVLSMVVRAQLQFLRLYIIKAGFRDGIAGFMFSVLSAVYIFIKYTKLLELKGIIRE